ncbi:MAG: MlaD family protein, partial [Actinomycetota bacterium]|nr:MlaD family protein [Actinomycetota bacterium]
MRLSPRLAVNLAVVLLLFVLTVGWVVTSVIGPSVTGGRFEVTADFADSGGVFTNQEVTYRGITVGQVGNMTVVPEGVEIELLIKEGTKIPEEDVEARVMFKSAVGEQFVDIL